METILSTNAQDRISALKNQIVRRGGSYLDTHNPYLRTAALWRAIRPGGRSPVQVRGACLHEVVRLTDIVVEPEWTLAGLHILRGDFWNFRDPKEDPEAPELLAHYDIPAEDFESVSEAIRHWNGAPTDVRHTEVGECDPVLQGGRGNWGGNQNHCVYWGNGWIENHSVRDYAKVLRVGFDAIGREIEERLAAADIADPEFPQQENFWRAGLDVCRAGSLLGRRYAEEARRLAAKAIDDKDRARLERIAEACERVPAQGARTLREATQSLWLAHILTCGEDGINANSIGRLDQILGPYYDADLEAGRITHDEAVELMAELACRLYLPYDVQAIVLGGLKRDGSDATNAMSRIILEATEQLDFVRDLSVRVHANTPPDFLELASRVTARGGGIPFYFNDDCFVKALNDRGIALEDARDYAPIGCIELTVPGRANPHAVSGWFNGAKCLELALFGGVDPRSGDQLGAKTPPLTEMQSFDELVRAYEQQVEFFAPRMVYHCNRGELMQRERGPLPCWSVLTDDCIARGRDITNGGPVYNYHSICFLGTANIADSLFAVKQFVFENQEVSAQEMLDALRADFAHNEPLRQKLLRRVPKYGNDIPEVDLLARHVDDHFITLMDRMRSPLGGRYFVHLFSFLINLDFGRAVGATPDGRRADEPLAYSLSAQQGRDENGVTPMLNSLARLPHDRSAGATAAIVELDPVMVEGPSGYRRLAQLNRTAFDMGVGQLQWNVTTVERLEKAQQDPEKYGNICVRVAGFSQIFNLIHKPLQDHIIARTKHRT